MTERVEMRMLIHLVPVAQQARDDEQGERYGRDERRGS